MESTTGVTEPHSEPRLYADPQEGDSHKRNGTARAMAGARASSLARDGRLEVAPATAAPNDPQAIGSSATKGETGHPMTRAVVAGRVKDGRGRTRTGSGTRESAHRAAPHREAIAERADGIGGGGPTFEPAGREGTHRVALGHGIHAGWPRFGDRASPRDISCRSTSIAAHCGRPMSLGRLPPTRMSRQRPRRQGHANTGARP